MGNSNQPIVNPATGSPYASIFEFSVPANEGGEISLEVFKGKKAYLVVNVASQWGLTPKNYEEMKILYDRHK